MDELPKQALVSAASPLDGAPIGWLYREPADPADHSRWRILAGDDSDEYADDAANIVLLPPQEVIQCP